MSPQKRLFIESEQDAFDALAAQVGGKKVLACALRPELADDPEAAHRWYLECVNPDRRQAFHGSHYLRAAKIGREHGVHDFIDWFADKAGYEFKPKARPSKRTRLLEEYNQLMEEVRKRSEELDRLDDAAALRDGAGGAP